MKKLSQTSYPWVVTSLIICLSGCGGGGGGGGGTTSSTSSSSLSGDMNAPTVTIAFPTPVSMTEEARITVRGYASDDLNKVSGVKVNNISASTTDDYANWEARVPLIPGMNTISVSATDAAGNINSKAAEITVKKTVLISVPEGIAIDVAGSQALVIDSGTNALIAIDLVSGGRRLISDNTTPDTNNSFVEPRGLALDSDNNRAFVADEGYGVRSLFSIDLSTGQRTAIATFDHNVYGISGVTYDKPRGRVLIAALQSIHAANLTSGTTSILSDHSNQNSQHYITSVHDIVLDEVNHRALLADNPGIASIDLTSGNATTIFNSVDDWINPQAIALNSSYNRILVTTNDSQVDANVTAIDLTTGDRSILSGNNTDDTTIKFRLPGQLAVDEHNNRVLVTDLNQIIAVNLANGTKAVFSDNSIPDKSNHTAFIDPVTMAFDAKEQRLFIKDAGRDGFVTVDLTTGARTTFPVNSANQQASNLSGMVVDSERNRILLADTLSAAIVAIDLATGEQTIFSNEETPGSIDAITYPQGLTLDTANNRLLVTDFINGLITVDLISGIATRISVNDGSDTSTAFPVNSRLIVDSEKNRAIFVSPSDPSVRAIDLATGEISDISRSTSSESGQDFKYPSAITWDRTGNRALILDDGRVIAVNITNGNRELISPNPTGNNYFVQSIIADPDHDRVYLINSTERSVVTVDLVSGTRMIVSK